MFENCRHVQSEDGLPVTASAVDIAEMSIDSTLRGQDREVSPSRSAQKDEACSLLVPAHLPNAPGAGRHRGEPRLRPGKGSEEPEMSMLFRSIRWPHTRHILSFLMVSLATGSTALAGWSPPGGFIEKATDTTVRPPLTPQQIQALLPLRGPFVFS